MSTEADVNDTVLLTLDAEACIGVGQCELLEPTVFRLDDDNISVFVGERDLLRPRAEIVVDKCPSGAIQIAEEN
ncbi:MAG: ferredoxin [Acidimicrobiales bacterium]|jgi:ferredoxin